MVARQCEIQRRPPNDGERKILAAEPRLDPLERQAVMIVVEAWFDLAADRQLGMTMLGDIPTLAIREWARDAGWDAETRQWFIRVIRTVDAWRAAREAERAKLNG